MYQNYLLSFAKNGNIMRDLMSMTESFPLNENIKQ